MVLRMTPKVCNDHISVFPLHYRYVCYKKRCDYKSLISNKSFKNKQRYIFLY